MRTLGIRFGLKWKAIPQGHLLSQPPSLIALPSKLTSSRNMEKRKFISIPKIHRRVRSEVRNDVALTEEPMELDPALLRPSESTPDLGIGSSALPTPGLFASNDQGPTGMQTKPFRRVSLTALFCYPRPRRRSCSGPYEICTQKRKKKSHEHLG